MSEAVDVSDGLQDDVELRHVLLDTETGQQLLESGMLTTMKILTIKLSLSGKCPLFTCQALTSLFEPPLQ